MILETFHLCRPNGSYYCVIEEYLYNNTLSTPLELRGDHRESTAITSCVVTASCSMLLDNRHFLSREERRTAMKYVEAQENLF